MLTIVLCLIAGMTAQQFRVLYVLRTLKENISSLFIASNVDQSGASSQSRASSHNRIRDFQ